MHITLIYIHTFVIDREERIRNIPSSRSLACAISSSLIRFSRSHAKDVRYALESYVYILFCKKMCWIVFENRTGTYMNNDM